MHELSMISALCRQVEALAREHGAHRVVRIVLETGDLPHMMSPDHLQDTFQVVRESSAVLRDASIEFRASEELHGDEIVLRDVEMEIGEAGETAESERLQVRAVGIVQGVGFRPFVFRLASELGLPGWVRNDGDGVTIEVEGAHSVLLEFLRRLRCDKPEPAFLYAVDHRFLAPAHFQAFEIRESEPTESTRVWILPDLGVCAECRRDILDPQNRRYRYPFTNCTHCGTRFTIIRELPYDRARTSMYEFGMCVECEREYHDPADRRFHAQPNACAVCGPQLEFRAHGEVLAVADEALQMAAQWIREGKNVALKGLGGFQLIADARNETALAELRRRKRRQNKPFAVMYPDLESLQRHVDVSPFAESLLVSAQAPILLLQRTAAGEAEIAPSVAPQSPYLGVFLPYTPLHLLLMKDLGFPVIATSGNLTDEPIQFQDAEAAESLHSICDAFLTHNRVILHHADDSVLQILTQPVVKTQMLRRARGYTPMPLLAPRSLPPLLALGGHMNVTFALSRDREVILSQHLGDMEGYESRKVCRETVQDLLRLYDVQPVAVVHDLHPDYYTTRLAQEFGLPLIAVQHHHAHMAACILENQVEEPVLGLTWDGTGYGPDKTIWGGEFLKGGARRYERFASLVPFRLPGGEKGIKEPWRTALSVLMESFGGDLPQKFPRDLPLFYNIPAKSVNMTLQILEKRLFSPVTTSMGRLFDAVSAILGISYNNTHQAESAQLLEYAAWRHNGPGFLMDIPLLEGPILRLDWRPMVRGLVERFRGGSPPEALAAAFHRSLAEAAVQVIERSGMSRVVLSGGVFCNRYLTEYLLLRLAEVGVQGYVHSQLPPTDGSLAAGQLWVAAHQQ